MYKDRENNKQVKGIIYLATFPNGKYYVGQTYKTLEKRILGHKISMKTEDYPVYRAMRKHGFENIKWEIIDTADSINELDRKEMYWINYYRSYTGFSDSNGYNANLGGGRNAIFTVLNEKELKAFGDDYRAGMSKDELQEKYHIEHRWTLNAICAGRQWNEFTGIPPRDFKIWPKGTKVTPEQVDDIIDKFKEIGRTEIIAKQLNVKTCDIRKIVKGIIWGEYTGIKDSSFYEQYHQWSSLLTNDEIMFIAEQRLSGGDFDDIAVRFSEVKRGTLKAIWNGQMLPKYTKIPKLTQEEKIAKPGPTKMKSETVDKILELNKQGFKGTEISSKLNIPLGRIHNILEGRSWSQYTGIKYKSANRRKLTKDEIMGLAEATKEGKSTREISEKFNVGFDAIYKIKKGISYTEITGILPNKE